MPDHAYSGTDKGTTDPIISESYLEPETEQTSPYLVMQSEKSGKLNPLPSSKTVSADQEQEAEGNIIQDNKRHQIDPNYPQLEPPSLSHTRAYQEEPSDGSEGILSTPPSSPSLVGEEDGYGFLTKSPMSITPYSSGTRQDEEFVIYSDSDGASQSSLDLKAGLLQNVADGRNRAEIARTSSRGSRTPSATPGRRRKSSNAPGDDDTPSPKPKKRIRRKSTKSADGLSERSHRSSNKHNSELHPTGTGYTSMPATGKIFRNLLILEESLREQVKQQRQLRRKYLTFLAVLCSFIASISHHLFLLDPKYSSTGTLRVVLQFALLALLVTLMLYHLSGEYQKTIVLPRKFLSSTNKGLRQLNVRLVKIKTPWSDSIIDIIREFSLSTATMCLNCLHKVYPSTIKNKNSRLEVFLVSCQSQCQPRIGVTDVKLILNARSFNTDVREGWELYRSEFWINEGVRRRNHMMAFTFDDGLLDRGKLLKKDKKDRKERKKTATGTETPRSENPIPRTPRGSTYPDIEEDSTDQFPIVSSPVANRLSEQNLQKLSHGFDYEGKNDSTYFGESS